MFARPRADRHWRGPLVTSDRVGACPRRLGTGDSEDEISHPGTVARRARRAGRRGRGWANNRDRRRGPVRWRGWSRRMSRTRTTRFPRTRLRRRSTAI